MTEAIVVDTCVLEHLFHPGWNSDEHIDRLLEKIVRHKKRICLDEPVGTRKSRMLQEYEHRMQDHWAHASERGNCLQWLRYLIYQGERLQTRVDLADALGRCLVPHLNRVSAERSDHVFVYVACALDSSMISNNARHITDPGHHFRQCARKAGHDHTEFVSSSEAERNI